MGEQGGGRRATDGTYISFREAVMLFATKEELAAIRSSISMLSEKVSTLVTREEHAARWQRDDEFRAETKTTLESLKAGRLPQWFFMSLGAIASIAIAVWGHFR